MQFFGLVQVLPYILPPPKSSDVGRPWPWAHSVPWRDPPRCSAGCRPRHGSPRSTGSPQGRCLVLFCGRNHGEIDLFSKSILVFYSCSDISRNLIENWCHECLVILPPWSFASETFLPPVGWNCTNSKSCMGKPALEAIALPSPGSGDGTSVKNLSKQDETNKDMAQLKAIL